MKEYSKIETLFNRDKQTFRIIEGEWRLPEFEYLKNCPWRFTEKIDGTNIRVEWDKDAESVTLGGRTDNAQIPAFLLTRLQELFPVSKFQYLYPDISMCLYGEGYGARIQKGGGNYITDGCDFILFDVLIADYWLEWGNICDIADKLKVKVVPEIDVCNLVHIIPKIADGFNSYFGQFSAEGVVGKPLVELQTRRGQRIVTKLKTRDFKGK